MIVVLNTDSKSKGTHTFLQKRVREYNYKFGALVPSTINLRQLEGRLASMKDDKLATQEEIGTKEMDGTRFPTDVFSQLSSSPEVRFVELKAESKISTGLSRLSVEKKSSSSLLPDGDSYLFFNVGGNKSNLKDIGKLLSEQKSICVLAITNTGLEKGTDQYNVSGYSCEFVENCDQLIYVNRSLKRNQILPDYLKTNNKVGCNIILEVINSGKRKA